MEVEPDADPANPFTIAAYAGTMAAAQAIGRAGQALTRDGLINVLSSMATFDTGLTREPLSWVLSRRENTWMRPYVFTKSGSQARWRPHSTSWGMNEMLPDRCGARIRHRR